MIATINAFEPPRMEIAKAARPPYRAMAALDEAVELDASLRDLISLRASIVNGCAYCVDMHTLDARKRGERERAALALTDAVTLVGDGHVPRPVWDEAAAVFADDELAQLLWAIVAINAWNRIAIATRMEPGIYEP